MSSCDYYERTQVGPLRVHGLAENNNGLPADSVVVIKWGPSPKHPIGSVELVISFMPEVDRPPISICASVDVVEKLVKSLKEAIHV